MRLRGPESFTAGGKTSSRVGVPTSDGLFPASSARTAVESATQKANAPAARAAANDQAGFRIQNASALRASFLPQRPPASRQVGCSSEYRPITGHGLARPSQHKRNNGTYAVLPQGSSAA